MDHHDMWFLSFVPNFSSLELIEVCQEPPCRSRSILGGHWGFLIGDLEDGVISDVIYCLDWPFWSCPESFMKIWLDLTEKGQCLYWTANSDSLCQLFYIMKTKTTAKIFSFPALFSSFFNTPPPLDKSFSFKWRFFKDQNTGEHKIFVFT